MPHAGAVRVATRKRQPSSGFSASAFRNNWDQSRPVENKGVRHTVSAHEGTGNDGQLQRSRFASPGMGQRLASAHWNHAAVRKARGLCDDNGALLPDLRSPVKARLKASANKSWAEFSISTLVMVSPRIRDVIENAMPGVHYF